MGIHHQGSHGIHIDDIIKILHGHIRNDYTFNPVGAITHEDSMYNRNPSLKDKIHCLVSVLPANKISIMDNEVKRQMIEVRMKARDVGLPQAVILTMVDKACPLVKANLEKIYTSRKIKEKVKECSQKLGVPESCIYPLKNYHKEDATGTKMDILILNALINIINFANDYVDDHANNE
ncbi:interferon-induced protein 44 [Misgurnus anguillicaudatus]|uniref:interferon-induced protein 44 n=1 Tax=Misgurnus anguillicaudatus TaxID=75329 RepID=UPI003CCF305F